MRTAIENLLAVINARSYALRGSGFACECCGTPNTLKRLVEHGTCARCGAAMETETKECLTMTEPKPFRSGSRMRQEAARRATTDHVLRMYGPEQKEEPKAEEAPHEPMSNERMRELMDEARRFRKWGARG